MLRLWDVPQDLGKAEAELAAAAASPRQLLVSSNRGGNFDIYKMKANGTGVVNLTNDPAADTNPRWCGNRIVFASHCTAVVQILSEPILC